MAKSTWLQEVEDDATRIQTRRFNEYFEDQQYQKEKAKQEKASKKIEVVEDEAPVSEEVVKPTQKKGTK